MNAGFLDVLHDAGDEDVLAVADRVDIDLDGIGEIAVDQHRAVARDDHRLGDVALELGIVLDDFHGAAAQHIGRADHHGEADALGDLLRFGAGIGDAVLGLAQFQFLEELGEAVAVFGQVDGIGRRAEDGHAGLFQGAGQLQRRLAAELHDDALQRAVRLFGVDDLEHVLGGQRFEIEAVGGVVVGRHGLGVAVDHDRFIARVMQREAGMAAAIVELDALADAVGPAAEDDDLLPVRGPAPRSPHHRSSTCRRWARRIRPRRYRCA